MPGKIVSKKDLAAIMGKAPQTLTIWQNEGMPYRKGEAVGDENQYDTSDVIDWYVRRQTGRVDPNSEKAALLKEQAEAARRKNLIAKGGIIEISALKIVLGRFCGALRQKIVACGMPKEERQALLKDIQAMEMADYQNMNQDEENADGSSAA
ncbi:MAG TPA: terminase small subunit [Xanthobacteraceae bacterium]|jgi:phage terminase Nu1 subunit (DNA packaging protein)|nr:terminase small subunit [Xanthobacteraceae bacterium]